MHINYLIHTYVAICIASYYVGLVAVNVKPTPRQLDKLTTILLQYFNSDFIQRLYIWLYPTDCTEQQFRIVWSNIICCFKNKHHMQLLSIFLYWIESQQKNLLQILSENIKNKECMADIIKLFQQQLPGMHICLYIHIYV